MRKLRNIYYLWFGSKIRQGFTVATPSLTPPLWMLWEANEGGGGGKPFYTGLGSLPPPWRAAGPLPPLYWAVGGSAARQGGSRLPCTV